MASTDIISTINTIAVHKRSRSSSSRLPLLPLLNLLTPSSSSRRCRRFATFTTFTNRFCLISPSRLSLIATPTPTPPRIPASPHLHHHHHHHKIPAPFLRPNRSISTTTTTTRANYHSSQAKNTTKAHYSKMASEIPKTMSGVVIEKPGGVDVLKYKTDLPVPEIKEGEVLVKNEYIGVNYIDTYFRTGLYPSSTGSYPLITGKEASGTVVASKSPRFSAGDRVVYLSDSTYAQYTTVSAARAVGPLPERISSETAAAALLQGLTALTFVREAAGIEQKLGISEGPWTLVHAAAGGTGSLLVQILSVMGAKVIATAGGKEKCELARCSGAQWTVDSKSENVVERVKEITNGRGVDVIFDGVGKATFDADLEIIARKGLIVSFGNASGKVDPLDILRLGAKNVKVMRPVLFGYIVTPEEWERWTTELFELIKSEKVKIKVHKVYPLEEVARAHTDLEGRKTTGKLLLKV